MCNLEIPGLPVISSFFNSFISELNEFGIRNIAPTISELNMISAFLNR